MISGIKNKELQITIISQILSESVKSKKESISELEEDFG